MCYLCGATYPLHDHHCLSGNMRKKCEQDGLKVWLCASCHRLVHDKYENLLVLKKKAQEKYEETHTRQEFIDRYGRNYLC